MDIDVKREVREFIKKVTRKPDIADDDDIFQGGIVNSLLTVQLIMFIEKNFKVFIRNDELNLDNFRTLNKIEKYVLSKSEN